MEESTTNLLVGTGVGICVGAGIVYAWFKGLIPGIPAPTQRVQYIPAPTPVRRVEAQPVMNPYRTANYSGLIQLD